MVALREHISNEAPRLIERRLGHSQNAVIAEPQYLADLLCEVVEQAFGTFNPGRPGSDPMAQDDGASRSQTINNVHFETQEPPAANAQREEEVLEDNTNPTGPNEIHFQDHRIGSMMVWQPAWVDDVGCHFWWHEAEHDPDVSPAGARQRLNTPKVGLTEYDTLLDVDALIGSVDYGGQDFEQFTSMLEQLIETASYPDSTYQSGPSGTPAPDDKRKDKGKEIEHSLSDALA